MTNGFTWEERARGIFFASFGFCAILFCIFTSIITLFSLFASSADLFAVSMSAQIIAYVTIILVSQFVGQILWYLGELIGARHFLAVCLIGAITGIGVEQILYVLVEQSNGLTPISILFAFIGFMCGFFAYDKAHQLRAQRLAE